MLDEEWQSFNTHQEESDDAATDLGTNVEDECREEEEEEEENEQPLSSPLSISTKTKIAYLTQPVNLDEIFWNLEIIPYSVPKEGVIKKQMKFNSHDNEAYSRLLTSIDEEKKKGIPLTEDVITNINSSSGRIKFKDVRKISVGLCSKDITTKIKPKSAFYNCFVIMIRIQRENGTFKEYHMKIFNTGKMEIPGLQTDVELHILLERALQFLRKHIPDIDISDKTDTILINSNFKTGYYINRDSLYPILQNEYKIQCVYDPCSYPGIQCKYYYYKTTPDCEQTGVQHNEDIQGKGYGYRKRTNSMEVKPRNKMLEKEECKFVEISIMIFRTGSILIVGMCSEDILYNVFHFFQSMMVREYMRIRQNVSSTEQIKTKTKKLKKRSIVTKP